MTYIGGVMIANKSYSLPESYAPGDLLPEVKEAFAVMQKAAAAQAFLNAVMAANPAALAAAAVLVLVAALYAGVAVMNHFAGTSVSATGIITGAFAVMGAFVFNSVLVPLQNGFAMFANFVGNVFTNPVAAVKVLF